MSRFYVTSPILFPPKLPLPGTIRSNGKGEHSSEPESATHVKTHNHLDLVLATFSGLYVILNEVYLLYRVDEGKNMSLAFALSKYSRLLRLADALPEKLSREKRTPHYALMFQ